MTIGHSGAWARVAGLALLCAGCAELTAPGKVQDPGGLIAADTVRSLDAPAYMRGDWTARLGEPDFVSPSGQFFAYQRGAPFRNIWQTPAASRATSVPVGSERDTVFFYQLVGVWLDRSGHVRQTRQFMAPCGSCTQGEVLMSDAEIDNWMRVESPRTP